MILAIASTIIALAALWRPRSRRRPSHAQVDPERWRTLTPVDIVVVGGFLVWHVLGANSSDDGYILQMA